MPYWLGLKNELVVISGVAEILCAVFLLPMRTRGTAAWCVIILLVAVFPANVQMAINYSNENHPLFWLSMLRLPFQFLLIWWAYQFKKPIRSKLH